MPSVLCSAGMSLRPAESAHSAFRSLPAELLGRLFAEHLHGGCSRAGASPPPSHCARGCTRPRNQTRQYQNWQQKWYPNDTKQFMSGVPFSYQMMCSVATLPKEANGRAGRLLKGRGRHGRVHRRVVTWQTSERMPVFQKPWLLSSTVTSRLIVFFCRIFWSASWKRTHYGEQPGGRKAIVSQTSSIRKWDRFIRYHSYIQVFDPLHPKLQ